jgi:hypothetical protein
VIAVQRVVILGEVGHEEIGVAVAIVITCRDAHGGLSIAPLAGRHAGQHADLLEAGRRPYCGTGSSLRVVADEDVEPTVAVEVGDDHPHRVARLDGLQ